MLFKTKKEQERIRQGGEKMGEILDELRQLCRPGLSTADIDLAAEKKIIAAGGQPAFKGYSTAGARAPFPATICASLNTELVHTIPHPKHLLKTGDIFSKAGGRHVS